MVTLIGGTATHVGVSGWEILTASDQVDQAGDVNIAPIHCCRINKNEDARQAALKFVTAPCW